MIDVLRSGRQSVFQIRFSTYPTACQVQGSGSGSGSSTVLVALLLFTDWVALSVACLTYSQTFLASFQP
jgi:hypothetical protein